MTLEELEKACVDDKTKESSKYCMNCSKNFDIQKDAIEKDRIKLEAATTDATSHNSDNPADEKHVIVPYRFEAE